MIISTNIGVRRNPIGHRAQRGKFVGQNLADQGMLRRVQHVCIAAKLVGAFSSIVAVMIVVGVVAWQSVQGMTDDAARVDDANVVLRKLNLVETHVIEAESAARGFGLASNEAYVQQIADAGKSARTAYTEAVALSDSAKSRAALNAVDAPLLAREQFVQEVVAVTRAKGIAGVVELAKTGRGPALMQNLVAALDNAQQIERDQLAAAQRASAASANQTRMGIGFGIGASVLLAAGFALLLTRRISRPMREVTAAATALAAGDLTRAVTIRTGDEIETMGDELTAAFGHLRTTIGAVGQRSTTVATSAETLACASAQIAANVEQTRSQAQTVSVAAEQVSQTCRPSPPAQSRWVPRSGRSR